MYESVARIQTLTDALSQTNEHMHRSNESILIPDNRAPELPNSVESGQRDDLQYNDENDALPLNMDQLTHEQPFAADRRSPSTRQNYSEQRIPTNPTALLNIELVRLKSHH
jgi:hypothetical protein